MKVLFFYQHFWPDSPPYANMLRAIGGNLSDVGLEVSMLTAQPSYKAGDMAQECPEAEIVDGISVKRLRKLPGAASSRDRKSVV